MIAQEDRGLEKKSRSFALLPLYFALLPLSSAKFCTATQFSHVLLDFTLHPASSVIGRFFRWFLGKVRTKVITKFIIDLLPTLGS